MFPNFSALRLPRKEKKTVVCLAVCSHAHICQKQTLNFLFQLDSIPLAYDNECAFQWWKKKCPVILTWSITRITIKNKKKQKTKKETERWRHTEDCHQWQSLSQRLLSLSPVYPGDNDRWKWTAPHDDCHIHACSLLFNTTDHHRLDILLQGQTSLLLSFVDWSVLIWGW